MTSTATSTTSSARFNRTLVRVITLLIAIAAICTAGLFAHVDEAHAGWSGEKVFGDLRYRVDYDAHKAEFIGYNGDAQPTQIIIPADIEGCSDITIRYGAFRQNENLTTVIINAAIPDIPEMCFYKCTNLKSITIPDSAKSVGKVAFNGCTDLSVVDFGSGVESIGEHAFYGCTGLGSVSLPKSLASMDKEAFAGCTGLTTVKFAENGGITAIPEGAFKGCSGLSSVTLRTGLKTIGASAFDNCKSLASCDIPASVTTIGDRAFRYAGITSATLPNGLKKLGSEAFAYSKLASVNPLPASLAEIGSYAFSNCQFQYIALPDTITALPEGMFYACQKMSSIALPRHLQSIGKYAFNRCSALDNLYIPKTVTSIGSYALCFAGADGKSSAKRVYFENGDKDWSGALVFGEQGKVSYKGLVVIMAVGSANAKCQAEAEALGATLKTIKQTGAVKITHDPNGGSGSMAAVELPKGMLYALPICTFTKPDGAFTYWEFSDQKLQPGQALNPYNGGAVKAVWDGWGTEGYTVSFSPNGGTGTMESITAKMDGSFTMPVCTFTPPAGKTFSHWQYTIGGVSYKWGEGAVVNPGHIYSLTVRAAWAGEYTVTFDAGAGTASPASMKTNGQGRLDAWPTATRAGYVLDCWSTTDDSGGAVSAGKVFTGNTTLHAVWEKADYYVITFDPNGGAITSGASSMETYSSGILKGEMPKAQRPGYKFKGWFTSGGTQMTNASVFDSNMTLHAEWEQMLAASVSLDRASVALNPGGSAQVKATVLPADALQAVTWSSSDTKIATVNASGKVTAVAKGTATVTATTTDGTAKTATCKVIVTGDVLVSSIVLDKASANLKPSATLSLKATVAPANAKNKNLVWTSSNPGVATVSASGKVTAMANGKAVITATAADNGGAKATCAITVSASGSSGDRGGGAVVPGTDDRPQFAGSAAAAGFADLDPADWYMKLGGGSWDDVDVLYIDYTVGRGLMTGLDEAHFGPHGTVTRAQAAMVLFRLANPGAENGEDANATGLPDVKSGQWYTRAVNWCFANGVVTGYKDGTGKAYAFGPDEPVTREQVAVMIARYCMERGGMSYVGTDVSMFSDRAGVGEWAHEGMAFCNAHGIMTGMGGTDRFGVGLTADRVQLAKIVAVAAHLVSPAPVASDMAPAAETVLSA